MTYNKECLSCKYLGICSITNAEKVLSHYVCDNYDNVSNIEVLQARIDILSIFGDAGVKAVTSAAKGTILDTDE